MSLLLPDLDPAPSPVAPIVIAHRGNPVSGRVTSPYVYAALLHEGRTRCIGQGGHHADRCQDNLRVIPRCRPCLAGGMPEWHGYLCVLLDGHADEQVIVRLGPEAIDPLEAYYDRCHSFAGAWLFAHVLPGKIALRTPKGADLVGLPAPLCVPETLGWTEARNRKEEF